MGKLKSPSIALKDHRNVSSSFIVPLPNTKHQGLSVLGVLSLSSSEMVSLELLWVHYSCKDLLLCAVGRSLGSHALWEGCWGRGARTADPLQRALLKINEC